MNEGYVWRGRRGGEVAPSDRTGGAKPRFDVTTIGEGQLRLTVAPGRRLLDMPSLNVCAAGSEANVAGLLAQLGRRTAWASILPGGEMAERVLAEYRSAGVDLSLVRRVEGGRVALYFLEPGAEGSPARVTYDRLATPFRDITPGDVDWSALLDTRLLFVTGLTVGLTASTRRVIAHAVAAAKAAEIPVALDVNHRPTLWSASDAAAALTPMLSSISVLFCSRRDAAALFGIAGSGADVAIALRELAGGAAVVTTDGASAVSYASEEASGSVPVSPVDVVDRPGAGDALVAGVLHGFLGGDIRRGVEAGVRAAAIALTRFGDLTRVTARDLAVSHWTDIVR